MATFPGTYNSTAPAVKSALVTALQALTVSSGALAGVQVTYGWPGQQPERLWLFLGNIHWDGEDWAALGARHREENYTIDLLISCQNPGSSDQEMETLAFTYLGVVESYLRNNPFQPATGQITALQIVPTECQTGPMPDGAEAMLTAKIKVSARI
jgi:hypothetical protein